VETLNHAQSIKYRIGKATLTGGHANIAKAAEGGTAYVTFIQWTGF